MSLSRVAIKAMANIATTLSHILKPVTSPSALHSSASTAPVSSVRTRHEKDPFISTQQIPSAVSVIHMASLMRPVASPHIMGSVPDKAIRTPQLIIGSKLSFWIS